MPHDTTTTTRALWASLTRWMTTIAAGLGVLITALPARAAEGSGLLSKHLAPGALLSTVVYSLIGMVFFGVAFLIFNKLMPFSVRKEIEEDQNTSLGIIIGSFLIGLAIIISSAMQ